ncbi:ABC transporter substrate-binding protein [Shinella sp.]|uniref:ABC transporter substrate-binding protein n=1 Tax=Shinella sp. TaxID=1870904 RepID=UPI003F6E7DA9
MTPEGLRRRAFLGGLAAGAFLPRSVQGAEAPNIVCLEWTSTEMLMSLGIMPRAVADVAGYRIWAVAPELPQTVLDLGSRGEPSMERITALKPDLIVTASGYGLDEGRLQRFAPVETLKLYEGATTALADTEREFFRLADRLGRRPQAEQVVADFSENLTAFRADLASKKLPRVAVISLFDDRHARVYGRNGLFQDVMDRLGVENAWTGETSAWGFATVGFENLVTLGDCAVISLQPVPVNVDIRIRQSRLWAALPAVERGQVVDIPAIWPFGGLVAAGRFSQFLHEALLRL